MTLKKILTTFILFFLCTARLIAQNTEIKQYHFFHNKYLVSSTVAPFEEDAQNTLSKLALEAYSDVKKYSFMNFLKKGMVSITVAELKENDTLNSYEILSQQMNAYGSLSTFTVQFEKPKILTNKYFSIYQTYGNTIVKGKSSSFLHISVLTNKNTIMTSVSVYEDPKELLKIQALLSSIKTKL
jgi:hypothetical protein